MHYIETIPGNTSQYIEFDLEQSKIKKVNKDDIITTSQLYCFDLYKLYNLSEKKTPYILDLQSLSGLQLNRIDNIESLFEEQFATRFLAAKEKINAHIKSYSICGISLSTFSLEELIPQELLEQYYKEKLFCIKKHLDTHDYSNVMNFYEASFEKLISVMSLSKNFINIDNKKSRLYYQVFGSKNSRLSIRKNSFNIYNTPKEKRNYIKAPDGFTFCQIDFKSFQPRLALSIFGNNTIKEELRQNDDIYSLFDGNREDNKIELISWMYSNRKNEKFDEKLKCIKVARLALYAEAQNGMLLNYFNRPLFFTNEESNVVFQNYICSVEADCILSLIKAAQVKLKDCKSYLGFPFHDCLVFVISDDEISKINELKMFMENYLYDSFGVSFPTLVKVGTSLGSLKDFD